MSSVRSVSSNKINHSLQSTRGKSNNKSMVVKIAVGGITLFVVGFLAFHYWRKRKPDVTDKTKDGEPTSHDHSTDRKLNPLTEAQIREIIAAEMDSKRQSRTPQKGINPQDLRDAITQRVVMQVREKLDKSESTDTSGFETVVESAPGTPDSAYGNATYSGQVRPPSPVNLNK